jgi:hypothetical protein
MRNKTIFVTSDMVYIPGVAARGFDRLFFKRISIEIWEAGYCEEALPADNWWGQSEQVKYTQ